MNERTSSLSQLLKQKGVQPLPKRVVLCGSTRFLDAFQQANLRETLAGKVVLSIGCDTKSDGALSFTAADKTRLDILHLCKIDLADEVLILNVDGYIGMSTARELGYAAMMGKPIRMLEPCLYSHFCLLCGALFAFHHDVSWLLAHAAFASCGCSLSFLRPLVVTIERDRF